MRFTTRALCGVGQRRGVGYIKTLKKKKKFVRRSTSKGDTGCKVLVLCEEKKMRKKESKTQVRRPF